eukprot:TRINITY_DN73581_c0_g1_i1.p1 TRINITY_DN73581_c0_g1~~TRINITY_DN73581_c0_g1_i1.p1  ORF type:complete len:252 (+),score=67.04 TRINITY_DN73581_c0_g1_i1:125-880(+)
MVLANAALLLAAAETVLPCVVAEAVDATVTEGGHDLEDANGEYMDFKKSDRADITALRRAARAWERELPKMEKSMYWLAEMSKLAEAYMYLKDVEKHMRTLETILGSEVCRHQIKYTVPPWYTNCVREHAGALLGLLLEKGESNRADRWLQALTTVPAGATWRHAHWNDVWQTPREFEPGLRAQRFWEPAALDVPRLLSDAAADILSDFERYLQLDDPREWVLEDPGDGFLVERGPATAAWTERMLFSQGE